MSDDKTTELFFEQMTGAQSSILHEAILNSFSIEELERFVFFHGFGQLDNIARPGNNNNVVMDLSKYLLRKGMVDDFVKKLETESDAKNANRIKTLRAKLIGVSSPILAKIGYDDPFIFEKQVKEGGYSEPMAYLQKLRSSFRRTCLIKAGDSTGTGFLIGPDLVMTAYHVIENVDKEQVAPEDVKIIFGHLAQIDGTIHSTAFTLTEDQWCVAKADKPQGTQITKDELDFAVIRLSESAGETHGPEGPRGYFSLSQSVRANAGVDVIQIPQHPDSGEMKYDHGVALEYSHNNLRLRHNVNTNPGSSGSAALLTKNGELLITALHHAHETGEQGKNLAVPMDLIKNYLDSNYLTDNPAPNFWL